MALSFVPVDAFPTGSGPGALEADPIRVIQAVIVGASFLGTGTIFRSRRGEVDGLTTAASLLMASGIGIAVAVNRIPTALAITALVLVVFRLLGAVERRRQQE